MSVKGPRKIRLGMRCPSCGQENPDGFRFCGACGAELTPVAAPREVRKTVTVLFCDVTGSTAMGERLDPESTRRVMARYFDAMRSAIERHGGTVEKFIGDAVMAVFGIPVVHEDDALRAVRAAVDMRRALETLNDELERDWGVRIESRIGINTGQVVAGEGDTLATGDAVNVAARLEQGAAPGETLLGRQTHRLVRGAVVAEAVEPLAAKGKSDPVPAFRLTGLVDDAEFIPRRHESPLVGRENELAQLQRAFDHAVSERVAYLFTLLGPAGIGKSRLVRELQERIDARFLGGRCLAYGDGITYWPLIEIEPVAAELNLGANRDEIALRTRQILEGLAREQPLVLVLDDLQWAEPTFLDLVDHVTDLARDAPMLVLCVARPELLEVRPSWGGGKLNATTMMLEALTTAEAEQLAESLVDTISGDVRARIAAAAEGNPLFVEEMLAIAEGDVGELTIPPTIQALLAARLDRLMPEERTAVECAAVQGQEFGLGALAQLMPEELTPRLGEVYQSLVRKDLVRPIDEERSAFKHLLLRDAAYDALPKERRADLHERFAGAAAGDDPGLDEIRGYHLEQAYRYRAELGPVDEHGLELAVRASSLLRAAGLRAWDRGDVSATINLLERAVGLLPPGDPSAVEVYPELGSAREENGDLDRAGELFAAAEAAGDERTRLRGRLGRVWLEAMKGEPLGARIEQLEAIRERAEQLGDRSLLAATLGRMGAFLTWINDDARAREVLWQALHHSEAVGDVRHRADAVVWLTIQLAWGQAPIDESLEQVRALLGPEDAGTRSQLLVAEGVLRALSGDHERGRELTREGRRLRWELGKKVSYAALSMPAALVELVFGDAAAADEVLAGAERVLEPTGERGYLAGALAMRAVALALLGRFDEAAASAMRAQRLSSADDIQVQTWSHVAQAMAAAGTGDHEEARRLGGKAAELIEAQTGADLPLLLVLLAETLGPQTGTDLAKDAIRRAEQHGDVVNARRAREFLAASP